MSNADDLKLIIEQEKTLVFSEFDELVAFRLGSAIRERALAQNLVVAVEIRKGPRPLFHATLPGNNLDNTNWLRRKGNLVHYMHKSSYRVVLEKSFPEDYFPPRRGMDNMEFVLAGGGYPIWVKGAGMVGSLAVSGLPDREDHRLAVAVLCDFLGHDAAALNLPAR
jgi:uncharacterized protein (UPF0303 family)